MSAAAWLALAEPYVGRQPVTRARVRRWLAAHPSSTAAEVGAALDTDGFTVAGMLRAMGDAELTRRPGAAGLWTLRGAA